MKLHKNLKLFKAIVNEVALDMGIKPAQVEKDYYVSLILKEISSVKDITIVFKGGTSLSKCYDVIERFSEDIDLTVLFEGNQISNAQKDKLMIELIGVIKKLNMSLLNERAISTRRSFNKYLVDYPRVFADNPFMINHIVIETITAYKPYPTSKRFVNNFISSYLKRDNQIDIINDYELQPFEMLVQTIERTFVDKVFAICDYYLNKDYFRHSRHIYDLSKIWTSKELNKNIVSMIMDQVIVERQKQKPRNPSSQFGMSPTKILRKIVDNDSYRADYDQVTNAFIFNDWPYELAKKHLVEIINSGLIPPIIM